MTAPWDPPQASEVDPSPDAPATEATPAASDELAMLDQLEADLTAVEQAIESLERVASEGLGGDDAASQIAAAVSVERFGAPTAPA